MSGNAAVGCGRVSVGFPWDAASGDFRVSRAEVRGTGMCSRRRMDKAPAHIVPRLEVSPTGWFGRISLSPDLRGVWMRAKERWRTGHSRSPGKTGRWRRQAAERRMCRLTSGFRRTRGRRGYWGAWTGRCVPTDTVAPMDGAASGCGDQNAVRCEAFPGAEQRKAAIVRRSSNATCRAIATRRSGWFSTATE